MNWSELGEWWVDEISTDPAYEQVVTPMLIESLQPVAGRLYLDLGSGDGRVMPAVAATGASVHGLDLNPELAGRSSQWGPTMVGNLPELGFVAGRPYDGAYCVLVIEHLEDHRGLFHSVAAVVAPGGVFALVMNHPIWTAPSSSPITDTDGEVLWRPGEYFSSGTTEEPAGENRVTFHHRTMSSLLNAAADEGWALEWMAETPHHELEDQRGIPRLLTCRWRLLP